MSLTKLSVSKAKCYLSCKKKFQFNYILRFPKKERDYHIFGTVAHKILEDFHNIYIKGSQEPYNKTMSKVYKEVITTYKEKLTPEMKDELIKIFKQYLQIISSKKSLANVLAVEKKFELKLAEDLVLIGGIDRIALDDDNVLHVADYKTTKSSKYLAKDFFQLLTYAFVVLSEDPSISKIRASYILLRQNFEPITQEFLAEDILKIKDQYIQYAKQMSEEKEYVASPSVLCGWCDYLDHCPDGKKHLHIYSGETDW